LSEEEGDDGRGSMRDRRALRGSGTRVSKEVEGVEELGLLLEHRFLKGTTEKERKKERERSAREVREFEF